MSLFNRQRELYDEVQAFLRGLCPDDEPLLGAIIAAHAKTFGNQLYGVGVTAGRLVLQPLDKHQRPQGDPVWLSRGDLVSCAIWGQGGGFREWLAENSEFELRFQTDTEHYKLLVLGGWTMAQAMGDDYLAGADALVAFLQSCQPT